MHFNNKISPQLTFLHYKCTSEVQQPGTENFVPNYINLATFGLEIVYYRIVKRLEVNAFQKVKH